MKKSLYAISLLMLLAVVFLGGARFSQHDANRNANGAADRQILHYVDPMDPAHISKDPGIAPCGMAMEPVYADEDTADGPSFSAALGAVKVNRQKQQIIGVRVGEATRAVQTTTIKALGRIVPDENRVYALIAPTDGWLEEISEGTTGSMVSENQVMAQIKVYNYDFFTWQQRYLTELGYTGRLSGSPSPVSTTDQSRRRISSGAGYQAGLPIPESEIRMIKRGANISQLRATREQQQLAESPPMDNEHADSRPHGDGVSAATETHSAPSGGDHSAHAMNTTRDDGHGSGVSRDNNLRYASKGMLELLNFGVQENQLQELAENGTYITHVDVRSPVNGYVLERKVSPLQKIDRGVECFRIADLGRVWVEADLYGIEAKSIRPGMQVKVSMPRQAEYFTANVGNVPPRYDAASRSLKIRLEMENPAYVFRPEMFVDVEFVIPLPESITVPTSAVIDSGKRQTVYVALAEGIFEPRAVVTGWRLSDRVEIVEGLQPGEKIAVSGNFLIDSESRMHLAAARLMKDEAEQPLAPPVVVAAAAPEPQPDLPAKKTANAGEGKDPVCGMTVSQDLAMADGLTAEAEGETYYFCSEECKEQFLNDPLRHPAEKAGEQTPTEVHNHGGRQHD